MTQKDALDILKLGKNVYLTGSAGSGKTYVLNQYISYLKSHSVDVAITASTGIAATHMNGVTIHSWSGIGIRDSLSEYDLEALEEHKYLWDRFQKVKVLIIDEVSMLHHFRLDLVNKILKSFKRNNLPFGGIQVVLCGDFFQLPPVSRQGEQESYFIYQSESWREMKPTICYLHEQHRHNDPAFIGLLNEIRTNTVSEHTYEILESRHNDQTESALETTRLYTHNADIDVINDRELAAIDSDSETYFMQTKGRPNLIESLKKSCLAPERLILKVGARVMCVKNNYEMGYVNGTLGKVVKLDEGSATIETIAGKRIILNPVSWSIEEDGKTKAEIIQIPLRLAWAITIHKSQGMSLDAIEVDLSKSFEPGMGYVALSRVRTLGGLKLLGINDTALRVHDEVLEFDEKLQEASEVSQEKIQNILDEDKKRRQEEFLTSILPIQKEKKLAPHEKTKALLLKKLALKEIAHQTDKTMGTIITHLEKLVEEELIDPKQELYYLKPDHKRFEIMRNAFTEVLKKTGDMKLAPVREILGYSYDFEELRIARLFI